MSPNCQWNLQSPEVCLASLAGAFGLPSAVRRRRRRYRRGRGATAASTAEWAALAAASPFTSAAPGVMRVGDSCDGLVALLLQNRDDGGIVRLPGAVGPQLVGTGR